MEDGNLIHYGVFGGAGIISIPTIIFFWYCCSGKKKINWKLKVQELKKEVAREEKILDKELKKVMEERKSLES
jgi:hypothetical protein